MLIFHSQQSFTFKFFTYGFSFFRLAPVILFFLYCFVTAGFGQNNGFDVGSYYDLHRNQIRDDFFINFPYDDYLEKTEFTNIQQLQNDRYFFWKQENLRDGDKFLYLLGDRYVSNNPLKTLADIKNRISIAEAFLKPDRTFEKTNDGRKLINNKINEIYLVMGYFLMATAARWVGQEHKEGRLDIETDEIQAMIKRMNDHKVFVEVTELTSTKLGSRDMGQLAARGVSWLEERKIFVLPALIVFIIVSLAAANKFSSVFKYLTICFLFTPSVFLAIWLAFYAPAKLEPKEVGEKVENGKAESVVKPSCHMSAMNDYDTYYLTNEKQLTFFRVLDEGEKEIGQAIFIRQSKFKIAYFAKSAANSSASDWLEKLKVNASVVLLTTGGYSNAASQPEGLTFERGNLLNAVLLHDRKALVGINCGNTNVINLKNGNVALPTNCAADKTIKLDKDPFVNLSAYSELLGWAVENSVTSFQTNLLAFDNQVLIDPKKARLAKKSNTLTAERRLLALIRNSNGEQLHVIFNINTRQELATASQEVFAILKSQKYDVEAIVNLDTGGYDIIEIFDKNGAPFVNNAVEPIRGTKDYTNATNLLVYYIDNSSN